MKMTLEKLRNTDESKLPDSDHPFKKDITAEEFVDILNEIAKKTISIKPLTPITNPEWNAKTEEILNTLNNTKNPY
jgi:hypothetical protein